MTRRTTRTATYAGLLLSIPAAIAWVTGLPFVFPSLGPTAYLMATAPDSGTTRPRRVVGGHAVGVLAGLLAYHLVAPGLTVTTAVPTTSTGHALLGASAVLSVVLTTAGMRLAGTGHAPACATTLIVSLGLLSSAVEAGVVVVAVVSLSVVHEVAGRLGTRGPA